MPEEKKNEVNPLDLLNENSASSSEVVENIVKTETGEYDKNILGDAPEIDMSLLEDIELPKSYLLMALKWVSGGALVFFVCSFLFFSFHFGFLGKVFKADTVLTNLEAANEELVRVKTEDNFYDYLVLKANLDRFSFLGDSFKRYFVISTSSTASNNEKRDANEKMAILRSDIMQLGEVIQGVLKEDLYLDLYKVQDDGESNKVLFALSLKDKFSDEAKDVEDDREARNMKQLSSIVGKAELRKLFVKADLVAMDNAEFFDFVEEVNKVTVNDFSAVNLVKKNRVRWSEVMNEIESRTVAIDSYHNDDYYDELGGIRYTSYDFNSDSGKLTLIGETKRFDTTNFTMTANLIDELNSSELFSEAQMSTFNKSGSLNDGYTSTLKLTVNLNQDE